MIALFNLIPAFLVVFWTGIWWLVVRNKPVEVWPRKAAYALIGFAVTFLLYTQLQPSYLPKGEVRRHTLPEFQYQDLEVQDRMRRTNTQEHVDRRHQMHEEFMEKGLKYND